MITVSREERAHQLAVLLVLVATAALPYLNSLTNDFAFDDTVQVLQNPYIQSAHYLRQIFTGTVWSFVSTGARTNYYRPMMTLGYLATFKMFGLSAFGFHLVNLLLHTCVVVLVYMVTQQMFRNERISLLAALIFALHPIHTESVAWVAAVTELELTTFCLLAFYYFLIMVRDGRLSRTKWLVMSASFVLALFSKEQAVMLPFLATVYEHFYRADREQTSFWVKCKRYAPLWGLDIGYGLFRIHTLGSFTPVGHRFGLTRYEIVLSAIALIGQYAEKLLWPVQLCAFYVFHKSTSLHDPRVLFGGLGAVFLGIGLFAYLWQRGRLVSFGLIWFCVTLAPVLNAELIGENVFTERYLYLPSVGFCWIVGWFVGCVLLAPSRRLYWRRAVVAAVGLVLIACAWRVVIRNRDWQNDKILFTRTLAAEPEACSIRMNLGDDYRQQGDVQTAERIWREALHMCPNSTATLSNLGGLYTDEGRPLEGLDMLEKAVAMNPSDSATHLSLAVGYGRSRQPEKAESEFKVTLGLAPLSVRAYEGLALVYWQTGDLSNAELMFKRGASILPYDTRMHMFLGKLYTSTHRISEAESEYKEVLRIDPSNAEALIGLTRMQAHN